MLTPKEEKQYFHLTSMAFSSPIDTEIEQEVNKLIDAGFIREVKYHTWIANIVPVRKKNGKLRICVDFET